MSAMVRRTFQWGAATFLAVIVLETILVVVVGVSYIRHQQPAVSVGSVNEFRPRTVVTGSSVDLCRSIDLPPKITPGNWVLVTDVIWTDWPFP